MMTEYGLQQLVTEAVALLLLVQVLVRGGSCQGVADVALEPGSAAVDQCSACLQWCMVQAVAADVSEPDQLLLAVEGAAGPAAAARAR